MDAGLTLGWVALVVLVALVGAPPPPPILSHSHSSRRDTGHTCFLSPWSRTAYSSGQHSDKRRQTQRRQEKEAILGCDQYTQPVKCKRQSTQDQAVKKYFHCFPTLTGLTCQCPPTSSLIQSHSYHSGQSGATGDYYERRDNLAHFDCTTGSAKSTATCR